MQLDPIFYLFSFTNVVNTYWLAEQALEHQKHFREILVSCLFLFIILFQSIDFMCTVTWEVGGMDTGTN